jgi:acetyl esterase/lipase
MPLPSFRVLASFLLLAVALPLRAAEPAAPSGAPIELWPEGIAGHRAGGPPETVTQGHVYHVRQPTLTAFLAPADKACGTAIIYCPGGGYVRLPSNQDGGRVRAWLNDLGVSVFVLKYRFGDDGPDSSLRDVLRAIRLVRSRAAEFGVKPDHIGVFGGSAGGHVVTLAGTLFDDPAGRTGSPLDEVNARPDFVAALYPVVTMEEPFVHRGSRQGLLGPHPTPGELHRYSTDEQVTPRTSPTFLVTTLEDKSVPMENSLLYYQALRRARVPGELHVYEKGPHGFDFTPNLGPTSEWPQRLEDWLRFHGWLAPVAK